MDIRSLDRCRAGTKPLTGCSELMTGAMLRDAFSTGSVVMRSCTGSAHQVLIRNGTQCVLGNIFIKRNCDSYRSNILLHCNTGNKFVQVLLMCLSSLE